MGGGGGFGRGGAFYNSGPAKLVNCTVASNLCIGGPGGMGGIGGSALSSDAYGGRGGRGGGGGSGNGSLYDTSGGLTMINCTLALNQGIAGSGGAGGAGGYGGRNGGNGAPGSPGPSGGAIGGLTAGGIGSTVWNTILASNSPGGNSSGAIRDTGHNLSSDASCNFTNVGSLNNTDPKLGPLTTNGGPTVTMALLPGSLAIDAGDNSGAPTTDQRGFPRPVGPAVDIGAWTSPRAATWANPAACSRALICLTGFRSAPTSLVKMEPWCSTTTAGLARPAGFIGS
jgi:hypothetical protein